jgi:hypothetical protein
MTAGTIALAVLFALLGFALGIAHFTSLRANVGLYLHGGDRPAAVMLHALRLVVIALAWIAVAALGGAVGLVAAFAGFLGARPAVTARRRRSS